MHYQFAPRSVCSRLIDFDLDEQNKIHNLAFFSGCPGNLAAISKLLEGVDAQHAIDVLKGKSESEDEQVPITFPNVEEKHEKPPDSEGGEEE